MRVLTGLCVPLLNHGSKQATKRTKPRDMVQNMHESIASILSLVKTTLKQPHDTPAQSSSADIVRLEQERTKQLELQLQLEQIKHQNK